MNENTRVIATQAAATDKLYFYTLSENFTTKFQIKAHLSENETLQADLEMSTPEIFWWRDINYLFFTIFLKRST